MVTTAEVFLVSTPDAYFAALYAETLAFGIFFVLFLLCLGKFIRNGLSRDQTIYRWLVVAAIVVMFCMAMAHSGIFLRQTLSSVRTVDGVLRHEVSHLARYEYTKLALEVINCFVGDLMVIMIAFTLGRKLRLACPPSCLHCVLYIVPATLLLASLATGIGMVYSSAGVDISESADPSLTGWLIAWTSLVFATNLVSTIVFAYELWSRTKRNQGQELTVLGGPLNELLRILMCNGILYCCTFTILPVLFLTRSSGCYVINHMIPQLAGIYPTLTIVIVAIRTNDDSLPLSPTRTRAFPYPLSDKPSLSSPRHAKFILSHPPALRAISPGPRAISPSALSDTPPSYSTTPPSPPPPARKLKKAHRLSRVFLGAPAEPPPFAVMLHVEREVHTDDVDTAPAAPVPAAEKLESLGWGWGFGGLKHAEASTSAITLGTTVVGSMCGKSKSAALDAEKGADVIVIGRMREEEESESEADMQFHLTSFSFESEGKPMAM